MIIAQPDDLAAAPAAPAGDDYTSESIQHLVNAEHIRMRPGMYIGDTGVKGLHHLVYELVYNAVDEALAGYCKAIHIVVHVDGSVSVEDDGRGIPVDIHPKTGRSTLELVLTAVGAGGKFGGGAYKVSAGLHGMGAKAVTALSEWTEARVRRNGRVYAQEYERGKAIADVKEMGAAPPGSTGTRVQFRPDPEIFLGVTFDFDTLEHRLRELAFLNKGLRILLTDERDGKKAEYYYEGGIAEFVKFLNTGEDVLHAPVYVDKTVADERGDVRVEVALQYTATGDEERVRAYANNAYNPMGGTHTSGFRTAMTRTVKAYGDKNNLFKSDITLIGEDFREGLTAIVSVQVVNPQFESQTKVRLTNLEVEPAVAQAVGEALAVYLEENPKEAGRIVKKVVLAAEARDAAARAKKALKDRKNILSGGGLPGKLMDCTTRDRDASELFLVEGDSAGGSAESGRDRMYQAILPLRGKPLNVEKARLEKVLANEEITSIISALGVDIGNVEEVDRVRYGKVIILTDADVDGQHIRTLLLTFFYRQMRKLVEEGRIFVARPPLFKVEHKKQKRFVQTNDAMARELVERGLAGTTLTFLPAAGRAEHALTGESLTQAARLLGEVEDAVQAHERRGLSLAALWNRAKGGTLPLYRATVGASDHWFADRDALDAFRKAEETRLGKELVVADATAAPPAADAAEVVGPTLLVQEYHEVRAINRAMAKLRDLGVDVPDLIPSPRVAGREPADRFALTNGDHRRSLTSLRELPAAIRNQGERGLSVTRFKGLGEMDPDELWKTTLDPAVRTLLRVKMDDAMAADEMFRVLMGEKVEPRRAFIQKHALEVKEIDYHGA